MISGEYSGKCIPRILTNVIRVRLDDNMEISIHKKASPEMRKTSYSTYLKVERTDKSYEGSYHVIKFIDLRPNY